MIVAKKLKLLNKKSLLGITYDLTSISVRFMPNSTRSVKIAIDSFSAPTLLNIAVVENHSAVRSVC